MDKFGLSDKTIKVITDLFKKYTQINKVIIFGSRARGNFKNSSDIDMAICGENIDFKFIRHISAELDELPTPYSFDVLNYSDVENNEIKTNIDKDGVIFYQK